jgi:hypothetical protein
MARPLQLTIAIVALLLAAPAAAQNWEFDARTIALGSAGGSGTASRLLEDQRPYRAIVLPLGLIQLVQQRNVFDPDSDEFDIIRSIELAASPLHYVLQREGSDTTGGRRLVVDIRNATLARDLNTYRGFAPARQPAAEGLASPSWGRTLWFGRGDVGDAHGVFLGAGPYLSMRTAFDVDQRLIDILASDTAVYLPNASLQLFNTTRAQMALALTGGYRGRFAVGPADDDVFYVGIDYNYLRGFRYEDIDTNVTLATNGNGLLVTPDWDFLGPVSETARPPSPIGITRERATSGHGFAIDAGFGVVVNGWDAGVKVNGIGNRIDWTGVTHRDYVIDDLFSGNDDLIDGPETEIGDVRVELPLEYTVHAGRRTESISALAEYSRGYNGHSFGGGAEYHLGPIDLRGGAQRRRDRWDPTAGVGINFGPRVSLDVAVFGTSANAERVRRTAIAASIRINRL